MRQPQLRRPQAVFRDADDAKLGPHLLQQAGQGARENRFVLGDDGGGVAVARVMEVPLDGSMTKVMGECGVRRVRWE